MLLSTRALFRVGCVIGLGSGCVHHREPLRPTSSPSTTITAADLETQPGQPIEQVLMGRFPGVEVSRTSDGGVSVRIRGTTSIHGSNEPLYVLDGVEIEPGPGGSLAGINPYDIATIQVISDPAGEAQYGVRGANGIIVINTKRPDQ